MSITLRLSFLEKVHLSGDIYTFTFSKPIHINHKAGQHGIFILPGFYRPHPLSLSSAPEEEYISFTTHIRKSSRFKQRLMQLEKGDAIYMIGPILDFTLDTNSKNHVFLAQGIGITPFRSMLLHTSKHHSTDRTTLIHVDSRAHTFRELTESLATKAHYPTRSEEFKKIATKQDTNSTFYISGTPRFIKATQELLRSLGVEKERVKVDSFFGY